MLQLFESRRDDFYPDRHHPPQRVDAHTMALVTEGMLHYELNGSALRASKGDFLFIPQGTRRTACNAKGTVHRAYAVLFAADGDLGLPLLRRGKPACIRPRSFDIIKELFSRLHRHAREPDPYYRTICTGIVLELLGMFGKEIDREPIAPRKIYCMHMIEQYIREHFRETIPLQRLAELIDRSPNYTLSLFREASGLTPLEYQHRLRIGAAMRLLCDTSLTVAAIAERLGYYDGSSFYKMFRKYTGLSPSEYAAQGKRVSIDIGAGFDGFEVLET